MSILQIVLAVLLAILIPLVSWRSLRNPQSHGFYRFFGFVATGTIIILNLPYWLEYDFSIRGATAELFLGISLWFVSWGVWGLRQYGGWTEREESPETLGFEDTARLVTRGLFRHIRHPMYSSLLLLSWGSCLKRVTFNTVALGLIATVAYIITAKIEERENLAFFGEQYRDYMGKSRMFIPWII
ncbi:methyltransferase family protein [Candidatus Zixiibacteriota bacterium]